MGRQPVGKVAPAVGRAMREHRKHTSGDWIAQEANAMADLGWTRTTVSRIERGERGLSADELLLLPAILFAATGRRVSLARLLAEPVRIGKAVIEHGESRLRDDYVTLGEREARRVAVKAQRMVNRYERSRKKG